MHNWFSFIESDVQRGKTFITYIYTQSLWIELEKPLEPGAVKGNKQQQRKKYVIFHLLCILKWI